MSIDLEHIRECSPIEEVVGDKFALKKTGTRFIGVEHDSLVVTPNTGFYFWNSRDEHGDVFDFVGRHMLGFGSGWNNHDSAQFMEAATYLAKRAGIALEDSTNYQQSPAWAERELVRRLHQALLNTPPALQYTTVTRGWQHSTVRSARLGFMPQDKHALLADLNLPDRWRQVVQQFPAGMLVYVHLEAGRLKYLSGRSIQGKRHYNPPREIAGEKQPYFNHCYHQDADRVVIVEGQADAVTFGEWQIPAVALAGMKLTDDLLEQLEDHVRVFVALDNTDDAREQSRRIAQVCGAKAYLPQLPGDVKDANDWLAQEQATEEDAARMLNRASNWLMSEVTRAGNLVGLEREDAIRDLFTYVGGLDTLALAQFKEAMHRIGVKARVFNELYKVVRSDEEDGNDDVSEVFDDSIPVFSPALGFRDDLALITVLLLERTRLNRLNVQPYLVTGTRELRRLDEEQVFSVSGREVALRVVPEGSEFLQRWRYSDIKRFLDGEPVSPGDVFTTINDLLMTYVDFRTPVESRVLTLWTVGTYFYQMFPAYPYVALNGPKNSGKSTVLRVLQPLAFNMITTSDPTGPSMFRLIHYTSCTVGIDEAERYHNPRDPGMQQIRQLLNSGYKAGMPTIRITSEDMKPQAFDVYSPKILAAIMGLEDVLASRCIAIPMRRTDRKLPSFPPDFDGARIRHMLYALAAFFEEEGGIEGLLEAISEAAAWDEQLSEGKALSNREEAVLQALEMLTHDTEGQDWIKAADLREKVRSIMGLSREEMGHAQWIGHILNRLQLTDRSRKKAYSGGQMHLFNREEVLDMMRRYDVVSIPTTME